MSTCLASVCTCHMCMQLKNEAIERARREGERVVCEAVNDAINEYIRSEEGGPGGLAARVIAAIGSFATPAPGEKGEG